MGRSPQHVIGFDLGGTKMLATIYDPDGKAIGSSKRKTRGDQSADGIFADICQTLFKAIAEANLTPEDLAGIGVGAPGPLDMAKGILLATPNLNLRRFPLKDRLGKEFKCPVVVENDVNAGTYGEFVAGAAKGFKHVLGAFPGTGIGGGLVLDGKLYRGATGAAGEIGHMILQADGPLCGCGQRGCLEALASRTAIAKEAIGLAANGTSPTIMVQSGTDLRRVTSKALKKAVEAKEAPVIALINRSATYLGMGIANAVNLLNPEVVVVGGGLVEKFGRDYLKTVETALRRFAMPGLVADVKLVAAKLGDDAVARGAAALLLVALAAESTT